MRLSRTFLFTLCFLSAAGLRAQECAPDPKKTLFEFFQSCMQTATAQKAENATKEAVTEMATTAAAPEGFAERVNDTIADFLPLFQFAVNGVSISDDKKSVVVKFNAPMIFMGRTGLRATVTEPQIFAKLDEKIVQSARTAEAKALLGKAGDFSDITYSFDWGLRRSAGNWRTTRKLFGREFETYEGLVQELSAAAVNRFSRGVATPDFAKAIEEVFAALQPAADAFGMSVDNFANVETYGHLTELVQQEKDEKAKKAKEEALAAVLPPIRKLVAGESAARLAVPDLDAIDSLIANQPELILKASYRNADEAVGQRETVITANYEMGLDNFNRVFREYRKLLRQRPADAGEPSPEEDDQLKLDAYEKVTTEANAENRFVFTATFKRFHSYSFRHSYRVETVDSAGAPATSNEMIDFAIPSSQEWHAKVLFSKPVRSILGAPQTNDGSPSMGMILPSEKRSRVDFSLEGIWVDEDRSIAEELRRKDRVVARLTFTQALPNNMSVPFSIVYANRSELLKDEKHQVSAHVALSYKFMRGSDMPQSNE